MRRTFPFRSLRPILLLGALLAALVATPAAAATSPAVVEVRLTDDGFRPATLRVHEGDEVAWVNASTRTQTLLGEDGSWDSGPLRPGERFPLVLRLPGTFRYATADGSAEGQLLVAAPIHVEAVPERPAAGDAARTLPDTGGSDGALALLACTLLLGGGLLVRAAGREQRRVR